MHALVIVYKLAQSYYTHKTSFLLNIHILLLPKCWQSPPYTAVYCVQTFLLID